MYQKLNIWLKTFHPGDGVKRFTIALCLALSTTFIIDWAKYHYLNTEVEERALDDIMMLRQEKGGQATVPPMVFFNIDEMTNAELQQIQPRQLLSRAIIKKMAHGVLIQSPEMVVLDYDFSFKAKNNEEDEVLAQFLMAAGGLLGKESLEKANPAKAHILLGWAPGENPYAHIVEKSNLLHWVGVRTIEDEGGITRRISHWDIDCTKGKEAIVPGIHWVARALLKGTSADMNFVYKQFDYLLADSRYSCKELTEANGSIEIRLNLLGEVHNITNGGLDSRIQYVMGWDLDVESPIVHTVRSDGKRVSGPLLENVIAFGTVLADVPPPPELIQDRIVLVGSAYSGSTDHFETPLGYIPGTVLLANAIKSFTEYGPLIRSPVWHKLITVTLLTMLAFLFFQYSRRLSFYDPILFKQAFLILSLGLWKIAGVVMVDSGAWMDILFPQYAVALYFVREDVLDMKRRLLVLSKNKISETEQKI